MWVLVGLIAGGVLVVAGALWSVLALSLRTGYSPVLRRIRAMNRRFTNPRVMRTAGTPGASASVVHHVGRVSGTSYKTPIGVVETADGFVITLPYGTTPDWLKNVRAAGGAVITTEGHDHQVGDPRIVNSRDVERYFSRRERLTHRIYGVDQFLILKPVLADVPAEGDL